MTLMTSSAKSYTAEILAGSQVPTVRIAPASVDNDAPDALKVLRIGGLVLDPWQENILADWLGREANGKWTSGSCGLSVPRQNGKTLAVQGRVAHGMLVLKESVVYTAHLQKTATETFEELKSFFEKPKIKKYVKEIRSALGREAIVLRNGARIKFIARTRNGGRGQHGDLLIFDEAQELDDAQQASFLPAISASQNPQTIYLGTPPDEKSTGTVFRKFRSKTKEGGTRNAWTEFSVDEIGDVTDQSRWAQTNPALGRRILLSTIQTEVDQMAPDTFARERLGWWAPVPEKVEEELAIDPDDWMACKSSELKPEGKTAYGIKFTADGMEVVLAGCVIKSDGTARVSLIDRQSTALGTRWLAEWLNQRYSIASCVVIDGRNGVDLLIDRISDVWKYKGSVIKVRANDVIDAATRLTTGVREKTLTWYEKQTALADSAVSSIKRPIAGGWGFGGPDSAPIEACALALWGASTCKRDPGRKMRIG